MLHIRPLNQSEDEIRHAKEKEFYPAGRGAWRRGGGNRAHRIARLVRRQRFLDRDDGARCAVGCAIDPGGYALRGKHPLLRRNDAAMRQRFRQYPLELPGGR